MDAGEFLNDRIEVVTDSAGKENSVNTSSREVNTSSASSSSSLRADKSSTFCSRLAMTVAICSSMFTTSAQESNHSTSPFLTRSAVRSCPAGPCPCP